MDKLLIVDDEKSIVETISLVLEEENLLIDSCFNGFDALEKIRKNEYDLVLLDIKMPKMDGIEVLEKAIEINPSLVVIMISGHGNIETAVESTKKGAYDFLSKPFDLNELKLRIKNALDFKKSQDEIRKFKVELLDSSEIIGISDSINEVRERIKKYSNLGLTVLITGESGTGKMLVAKQIHYKSDKSKYPFININCATLTEQKFNKELFGDLEENISKIPGKLIEASGGTVLFDEISSLNQEVQSMILKVIDENKYSHPGQINEININARYLFSTNRDIESLVQDKLFREDLFHRINVLNIHIPPLRERVEDIPVLINYFTNQICKAYNINVKKFTNSAVEHLTTLRFPGNVRELKNLIERLLFTIDKDVIDDDDIEIPASKHTRELSELLNKNLSLNSFQNESERIFLVKMLNDCKNNISQTADVLEIQRSHLYKLMSKYDIPTPTKITGKQ